MSHKQAVNFVENRRRFVCSGLPYIILLKRNSEICLEFILIPEFRFSSQFPDAFFLFFVGTAHIVISHDRQSENGNIPAILWRMKSINTVNYFGYHNISTPSKINKGELKSRTYYDNFWNLIKTYRFGESYTVDTVSSLPVYIRALLIQINQFL